MAGPEYRARLAALVAERRQRLQLSVSGAARIARVSRGTWIGVENATRETETYNYAGVERALQWTPGSIESVLRGGDPQVVERNGSDPRPSVEEMPPGELAGNLPAQLQWVRDQPWSWSEKKLAIDVLVETAQEAARERGVS